MRRARRKRPGQPAAPVGLWQPIAARPAPQLGGPQAGHAGAALAAKGPSGRGLESASEGANRVC